MAIQINGNGTITGISSGGLPAGSVTSATLADGAASGTKLTMPAGSVVQVVYASYGPTTTNTTTSYADTGLTATITPTSSSNKIHIIVSQPYRLGRSSASDVSGAIQLYRSQSGTNTAVTSNAGYLLYHDMGVSMTGVYFYNVYNVSVQDSPNTTSAVSYVTKARTYSGSSDIKTQYNGTSYMTLMEIKV